MICIVTNRSDSPGQGDMGGRHLVIEAVVNQELIAVGVLQCPLNLWLTASGVVDARETWGSVLSGTSMAYFSNRHRLAACLLYVDLFNLQPR